MLRLIFTAALSLSSAFAVAAPNNPGWPTDPRVWHLKTVEAANGALAKIEFVSQSVDQFSKDREPLKLCHAIGTLQSSMLYLASWASNGPSTPMRIKAINEVMPMVAEINLFCRVTENLKDPWGPRPGAEIRTMRDIQERLEFMKVIATRISTGQIR